MLHNLFHDDALRAHLEAPLLSARLSYLESKKHRGRDYLKRTALMLLNAVESFGLRDDCSARILIGDVILAGEKWAKARSLTNGSDPEWHRRKFTITVAKWLQTLERFDLRFCSDNIITRIFQRLHNQIKYVTAPLLLQRTTYLESLESAGYSKSHLVTIAEYQLHAIDILRLDKNQTVGDRQLHDAADKWVDLRKDGIHANTSGKSRRRTFLECVGPWLAHLGWLRLDDDNFPGKSIVRAFLEWGKLHKGYSDATCRVSNCCLRLFMMYLFEKGIKLNRLLPAHVDSFIMDRAERFHWRRITLIQRVNGLRVFLEYCSDNGICPKNVAQSVITPKMYPEEDVPSYLPWDSLKALLQERGKHTNARDIRDHAVLLIFATYGIRSGELARLKLDDIDWRRETITITRTKNRRMQVFPLNKTVGDSIIEYLRKARPQGLPHRTVFLSLTSPIRPMTPSSLYGVVSARINAMKASVKHKGPHCLRHSCATHLVNSGLSFKEVSDLLGHKQMDSTYTYAKIDFASLKSVSDLRWEVLQ